MGEYRVKPRAIPPSEAGTVGPELIPEDWNWQSLPFLAFARPKGF